MDKENIKKLIIKFRSKLIPMTMALILTLGALFPAATAEAKVVPKYATCLQAGDSYTFNAIFPMISDSQYSYKINDTYQITSGSDVYALPLVVPYNAENFTFYRIFFSLNPFECSLGDTFTRSYSGITFYITNNSTTLVNAYSSESIGTSDIVYYSDYFDDYSNGNFDIVPKMLFELYSLNFQIGTETIETNYAGSSSENIENVLGVLMNPYTGGADNTISGVQNNEWSFLWKWTPPIDTSLTMEISADVEYTDSVVDNLLTAVKNSWKTVSVPLYPYEDGLEGAKGTVRFTYDFIKEKVAGQIGEDPKKVRLKTVYFRYAKENEEGVVEYGQYTTFTPTYSSYMDVQPKVGVVSYPTGQYHSGVTERFDPITGTIPETSVNISGPDADEAQGVEDFFGSVLSYLRSGTSFLEQFPLIMRDIFMSIPPQIMTMVTVSFGLLIALRIFGR